jgi:hypothetical protein
METVMIRHDNTEWRPLGALVGFSLLSLMILTIAIVFAAHALAASARVKVACASDYFAHCSKFPPNSQATRNCMNDVGDKLSKRCVNALVADGEVSGSDVAEHVASKHDDDE